MSTRADAIGGDSGHEAESALWSKSVTSVLKNDGGQTCRIHVPGMHFLHATAVALTQKACAPWVDWEAVLVDIDVLNIIRAGLFNTNGAEDPVTQEA
jgi:hypothetical protein